MARPAVPAPRVRRTGGPARRTRRGRSSGRFRGPSRTPRHPRRPRAGAAAEGPPRRGVRRARAARGWRRATGSSTRRPICSPSAASTRSACWRSPRRAGVVEKTVFNHFPVKEGLVFDSDPPMRAALLEAVRRRPAGESVAAAAGSFVVAAVALLGSPEAAEGVAAMARVVRGSRTLQIREREILGELTAALAQLIGEEASPTPGRSSRAGGARRPGPVRLAAGAGPRPRAGRRRGAGAARARAAAPGPPRPRAAAVRAGRLRQAAVAPHARELQAAAAAARRGRRRSPVPGEQRDGHHVAVLVGPAAALGAEPPDLGQAPWARGCRCRSPGPWPGSWPRGTRGPPPWPAWRRGRRSSRPRQTTLS